VARRDPSGAKPPRGGVPIHHPLPECRRRLWGVRNIWADASAAQQLATSLADHADQQFQEIAKATKWERYVAQPTIAYRLFESIGFGSYTFAGHRSWGAQLSGSAIL
jgi:hypothetical protein